MSNFASTQIAPPEDPSGYVQARQSQERAKETAGSSASMLQPNGQFETESRGLHSVDSSIAADPDGLDVVDLGSLQTSYGSPRAAESGQVTPNDTIEIKPGLRTRVSVAANLGYVTLRDGNLSHTAAAAASPAAQEPPQEPQEGPKGPKHTQPLESDPHAPGDVADSAHGAAIETLEMALDPTDLRNLHKEIIGGEVTDRTLEKVATTIGASFDEAAQMITNAADGFSQLYRDAVAQAGVASPEAQSKFVEWAARNRTPDLNKAQSDLFAFKGQAGMANLARDFMANYDVVDPEQTMALVTQDLKWNARRTEHGTVMVQHPELGWMTWSNAYKQGLFPTPTKNTKRAA